MGETFYLAASWVWREQAWHVMKAIEKASRWECTSTWLQQCEESEAEAAARDLRDVARSKRFVFLDGHPRSPGKHVELGYALALKKDITIIGPDWLTHPVAQVPPWRRGEVDMSKTPCIFKHLCPKPVNLGFVLDGKWEAGK